MEWEHSFGSGWRSTISGWGKWYQDLASASEVASGPMDTTEVNSAVMQYAISHATELGIPDSLITAYNFYDQSQASILRSYVPGSVLQQFVVWSTPHRLSYASTGIGWAAGIEASLRYRPTDGWTGWASAEWSISRRKDFDGGIWYPFGQERPWKFSWVNAFWVNRTWELSIRYSALGGNPYTPFKVWNLDGTENTYNSTPDTTIWIGRRNSGTLAPYQRLDLRIAKESTVFGHGVTWYWEMWNALNDPNFVLRDGSTGEFRWITTNLPIPIVFVGVQTRF
jgi:hypothetical protein